MKFKSLIIYFYSLIKPRMGIAAPSNETPHNKKPRRSGNAVHLREFEFQST
jgi:hypothetical protein